MRFVFIIILLLNYVYADLDSEITSNAQNACYLKNPTNGLSPSDYSPTVIGQTLRQSIESTHTSTQSEATCDSWLLDPYVNIDTETYQVIANMDCIVNSEQVTTGSGDYETTTTEYWTVINQYALDIDCQESCEVPRDSNGNIYDFTPYISETDCTVPNLQQLVLAEDPNSLYTIDDTQYLNCEVNSGLTGCYYKLTLSLDDNTDSNSTDNDDTLDNADLTDTNQLLDDIGTKIDSITDELKFQNDRLHDDLKSLESILSDTNTSSVFYDSGIINSIQNNTNLLTEIKDIGKGELDDDASFFDSYEDYFLDVSEIYSDLENDVNDIMATIEGDYTPHFQIHSSCTIDFSIMGKSNSVDMCRYSYMLKPFITFILTIYMLILLIRLHFYLFPKVYKSD